MNHLNEHSDELRELLTALVESRITAEQHARLETLLRTDEHAADYYTHYMSAHAMLVWQYGAGSQQPTSTESQSILLDVLEQEREAQRRREAQEAEIAAERARQRVERQASLGGVLGASEPVSSVRHYVIPRAVVHGAVAALLIAAVLLIWRRPAPQPETPGETTTPILFATVVEQLDARWEGRSQPLTPGDRIANESLKLTSGIARLRFDNEAEVVIEAPATIELLAADRMRLVRGKLVGHCNTPASRGFSVRAARADIVDLGTEFALHVGDDNATDAYVLKGEVDIRPDRGGSERLRGGGNAHVDGQGTLHLGRARMDVAQFRRTVEPYAAPRVLAWWTFNELDAVSGQTVIADISRRQLDLHLIAADQPVLTVAGHPRYGGSAASFFDAERGAATLGDKSDALNFSGNDSFTIEAMIRTDAHGESGRKFSGPIIAKDWRAGAPSWWLRVENGQLRFLVSDGVQQVTLDSDIRINDGKWHHVAAVRDTRDRELRMYVDHVLVGRIPDPTHKPLHNDRPVQIGTFNESVRVDGQPLYEARPTFLGAIDFIRVVGEALTPERMIQPTSPET